MMKKIAITCALLSSLVASSVWADAASDLKSRLDKVSSFHASFTQKVTDGSGAAVQEGRGDLWVKRPNLFNWHMTQPDESILVSDGKTLWFYNPFGPECRSRFPSNVGYWQTRIGDHCFYNPTNAYYET